MIKIFFVKIQKTLSLNISGMVLERKFSPPQTSEFFSRNSEDITESFPDLKFFSSQHHVIDGELLIKKTVKFSLLICCKKD